MLLLFATDVHGSEVTWRKFVNSAAHYKADVIILGGDMTGKALVPIVRQPGNGDVYESRMQDQVHVVQGGDELTAYKRTVRDHGFYPVVVDADQMNEFAQHPELIDQLFTDEMQRVAREWVAMADERLPEGVRCIVCPGNDDRFDIDQILAESSRIVHGEGISVDIGDGYQVASSGWTNPTPWDTPREEADEALAKRLAALMETVTVEPDHLVLSLHAPPYGTTLDVAPKINWDDLVVEAQQTTSAGSKAVRELVDSVQPVLGLFGHIHESRAVLKMGRTLAVNPGSAYDQGTLMGFLVDLNGKPKLKRYQLIQG